MCTLVNHQTSSAVKPAAAGETVHSSSAGMLATGTQYTCVMPCLPICKSYSHIPGRAHVSVAGPISAAVGGAEPIVRGNTCHAKLPSEWHPFTIGPPVLRHPLDPDESGHSTTF